MGKEVSRRYRFLVKETHILFSEIAVVSRNREQDGGAKIKRPKRMGKNHAACARSLFVDKSEGHTHEYVSLESGYLAQNCGVKGLTTPLSPPLPPPHYSALQRDMCSATHQPYAINSAQLHFYTINIHQQSRCSFFPKKHGQSQESPWRRMHNHRVLTNAPAPCARDDAAAPPLAPEWSSSIGSASSAPPCLPPPLSPLPPPPPTSAAPFVSVSGRWDAPC